MTEANKPLGARARVRAELTAEIKASARRQLAIDGASALSLRAIAREMGMASSALYRYFASRDELLTALIVDAYDAIGDVVERASAQIEQTNYEARFVAIALAIRSWAQTNPHEYALIYGSPVPGYAAPETTIDPAVRVPLALTQILVDVHADGGAPQRRNDAPDEGLGASLAGLSAFIEEAVPVDALALGVRAWAEIFGLVSLELFGHFTNAITDTPVFFEHAARELASRTLGQ